MTMDDYLQDTDICYVTSQMARRIFWQLRVMPAMEMGNRELPREWLELADEWSNDHRIGKEHGIMALIHLRSIFGMDFEDIVLRVILDDAFEAAKAIELVKEG